MSRAAQLNNQHSRSCALVLTLFLFQKGQGFFPPLPIAALLPRSRRWAGLPLAGWEVSMWLGGFCGVDEWAAFPFSSWRRASLPLACRNTSKWLGYFCNAESQREIKSTLACIASHEARRRMAAYIRQPAGSRTKPASREACRRAAVALRPSRMSSEHPRAQRARCGVKGYYPLRGLVRPSKRATMRKPARL